MSYFQSGTPPIPLSESSSLIIRDNRFSLRLVLRLYPYLTLSAFSLSLFLSFSFFCLVFFLTTFSIFPLSTECRKSPVHFHSFTITLRASSIVYLFSFWYHSRAYSTSIPLLFSFFVSSFFLQRSYLAINIKINSKLHILRRFVLCIAIFRELELNCLPQGARIELSVG